MMRLVLLLAVACSLACAEPTPPPERAAPPSAQTVVAPSEPTPPEAPEPVEARPEPPWPDDMPSMFECANDDDCVYLRATHPTSSCCDTTGERAVRGDWYDRVMELRQSGVCEHVACPRLTRPSAASHGPGVPGCRPRCRAQTCGFVCDVRDADRTPRP